MKKQLLLRCVWILLLTSRFPVDAAQSLVAPGATLQRLPGDYAFTEGPAADPEGNVYFTDQPNNRIVKWNAQDGTVEDWLKPAGRSNGMYFSPDGDLIACADGSNELWAISAGKEVKVVLTGYADKLLNGPNDLWIRPDGGIYFTDPLYARDYWKRDKTMQQDGEHLYYLPKGATVPVRVDTELEKPNGIIGSPDGKTLYVADIGAGKTYAYDIARDGTLSSKRLFCSMGSDGMTIDARGNIYLTGRGVTVFDKAGKQIDRIDVPEGWTANVTFAGKDRDVLFITASKSIYAMKMSVKGAAD